MTILFVTIAWPSLGERNLYLDLMNEFKYNGHVVYILCANENNSTKNTYINENGFHVFRIKVNKLRKSSKIRKTIALFTLGFKLRNNVNKIWDDLKIDLIIGHSPPVTLSGLFKYLVRKYQAPLYYLLKDIWPHGPADLNIIRKSGLIFRFFRYHEIRIYKLANYIGCMSEMNVKYILSNNGYLSKEKVEVCPNSISPRNLMLGDHKKDDIRRKYNIPLTAKVFIFSGNIGKAHGIVFLLDAIQNLEEFDDAYFLIGGGGVYFNYVKKEILRRQLTNIYVYSKLPAEEFDQLLLTSDVGVILLDSSYNVPQFPSRILAYFEAKLPVLCAVNKNTDIGLIVEQAGCGLSTLHGDIDSFIKSVKYFCNPNNQSQIDIMKFNSLQLLYKRYTSNISYNIISNHFNS